MKFPVILLASLLSLASGFPGIARADFNPDRL